MNIFEHYHNPKRIEDLKRGDIVTVIGDNEYQGELTIGKKLIIDQIFNPCTLCDGFYGFKCPSNSKRIVLKSPDRNYPHIIQNCYYILGDEWGNPIIF
jgi:hypothetical protein